MVVHNDFDQDEIWVDKFAFRHPIARMATAHRIYAARMLDRKAEECAMVDAENNPLGKVWDYETDAEFETAELNAWLREHDPNEWIQSTTLYRALMDLPEPVPEEDRDDDDPIPEEGRPIFVDGGLLLREEIVPNQQVGGPAVRADDGSLLEQTPEGDRQDAGGISTGRS